MDETTKWIIGLVVTAVCSFFGGFAGSRISIKNVNKKNENLKANVGDISGNAAVNSKNAKVR